MIGTTNTVAAHTTTITLMKKSTWMTSAAETAAALTDTAAPDRKEMRLTIRVPRTGASAGKDAVAEAEGSDEGVRC